MPAYQQKVTPPFREPPDVLLCQRTIKSLQQENAQLKERLELQLDRLAALLKRDRESDGLSHAAILDAASSEKQVGEVGPPQQVPPLIASGVADPAVA